MVMGPYPTGYVGSRIQASSGLILNPMGGNVGIGILPTETPQATLEIHKPGTTTEVMIGGPASNYTQLNLSTSADQGGSGIIQVAAGGNSNATIGTLELNPSGGLVTMGGAVTIAGTATMPAATIVTANISKWITQTMNPNGFANMGGVIIQWGTVGYTNNGTTSITFSTPFTNLFTVTATLDENGGGGSGGNVPVKIHSTSTTGFSVGGTQVFSGDNTSRVRWIALGN
jgi:hypothetical protein